jgi:hypothetical protein
MIDKFKDFLKNNWAYLAIGLFVVLGFASYRKKVDAYENIVRSLQESHQKELDEIKKVREEERKGYEANERKYKERMAAIEKEYETAKIAFEEKKQSAVKQVISTTGGKPDKLAEKLAEVTGFKIVMPEE